MSEPDCPHCGADLRTSDGGVLRHRTAILLGLTALATPALAACGDNEGPDGQGGSGGTSGSSAQYPGAASSKYAGTTFTSTGGTSTGGTSTGSSGFDPEE